MARVIAVPVAPESRSRLLILAAGVCAAVAAVLVFVALQHRSDISPQPTLGLVPVVVAARDLNSNTTLTGDLLIIKSVPPDVALSGAFERTEALLGKATRYPVSQGQQLTSSVIGAGAVPNDNDLSYALPPGKRAVGVEVSEVTGVGGLLLPGNSVDVIAVFSSTTAGATKAVTLLQNVVVLAVGQEAQRPAPRAEDGATNDTAAASGDAKRQPDATTVTLAVTPAEAQVLAVAQDNGKLWLTLRPSGDSEAVPLAEQPLPVGSGEEGQ
jgi:pilus assembly protein CpaB